MDRFLKSMVLYLFLGGAEEGGSRRVYLPFRCPGSKNLIFVLLTPSTVLLEALLPVSTGERCIGNVLGENGG